MRKRVRLRQKADSVAVNLIGVDLHVISGTNEILFCAFVEHNEGMRHL